MQLSLKVSGIGAVLKQNNKAKQTPPKTKKKPKQNHKKPNQNRRKEKDLFPGILKVSLFKIIVEMSQLEQWLPF